MLVKIIFGINLIISSAFFCLSQIQPYMIRGRVVDDRGVPVKNALIFYNLEEGGTSDGTFEGVQSDVFGKFSLSVEENMKLKLISLFVASEIPNKAMTLMYPPFTLAPPFVKNRFAGPRIVLNEQKEIDVGDVLIKAVFLPVTLVLLNDEGNRRLNTPEQWSHVVVRILDQKGTPVAARGMSQHTYKECVTPMESEIRVALPEGDWRIEVSINDFSGPFFGVPIKVSKSNNNSIKASIIISDKFR